MRRAVGTLTHSNGINIALHKRDESICLIQSIKRKKEEVAIMLLAEINTARIILETCFGPGKMPNYPCQLMGVDEHTRPGRPLGGVCLILQPSQEGKVVRRYIVEYSATCMR